jgi:hypothetical protein
VKRGDWIRLRGRKIAHLVICKATWSSGHIIRACELNPLPDSCCTVDPQAPRCKKCLKAMEIARRGRN